jgi:Response regulator of the LytR/AlgR family
MRVLGKIAYWLAALAVLSAILVSLDYRLGEAVLISLLFCPCALALEYLMPKARKPMDKVYVSLAMLVAIILFIMCLHRFVWREITQYGYVAKKTVAPMLINPAFLGLILTVLSIGDYYWSKWLDRRFKAKDRTVTFFSERKSVTLPLTDIAYVESNDTEVRIVTTSGESFRNKTGISQWENLLGGGFLRIHRSYLVNTSYVSLSSPDLVTVVGRELPVSRKYKESVKSLVGNNKA